ncbi:MAG: DUF434 domain-containing protein [Verrucomicrobiota bacterium]
MPDSRSHRGLHPQDAELFSAPHLPALRTATEELSWLLGRGYAPLSSLKLVGDRHALRERQRDLVSRAACTDAQRLSRRATRLSPDAVRGADLFIDGFNLLITLEAALGGGLVFKARDGALRDLASVHGTYRAVEETDPALLLAGETLAEYGPASVTWLFDQPVSNSGRLVQRVRGLAETRGWPWEVRLSRNPDQDLMALPAGGIAVTTDSLILDHAPGGWLPLSELILSRLPPIFIHLDLSVPGA